MGADRAPAAPPSLSALRGQDAARRTFRAALGVGGAPQRVAGAYLLHGPEGVGRSLGALGFAAALLCASPDDDRPCGTCRACRWNAAGTHPDLVQLSGTSGPFFKDDGEAARAGAASFTRAHHLAAGGDADGAAEPRRGIPVRSLRRALELLALSAVGCGRKVVVLDALDDVEEEGVATLLKSLEEPPPETTFLLLARGTDGVPDTILSRCQRVRFQPLAPEIVRELLAEHATTPELDDARLELVVRVAQGSAGRALRAVAGDLAGRADDAVLGLLAADRPRGVEDALAWVLEAGRDLASRRARLRELVALALLRARDAAARRGSSDELDALLPALTTALESTESNVAPELVLHALWARVARARRLTN